MTAIRRDLRPVGDPARDLSSIEETIGHTPLVAIPGMCPNPDVTLLAKLEMFNPTGSLKDRIAVALIDDLERSGRLTPRSVILEPTSGNTGISLAMVARRRGYRLAVVMPDNVTEERRQILRAFGAEIIESPGAEGSNGAVRLAKELVAREPVYVMPYQYGNPANPRAHYETTAVEILEACPDVDVFVAGLGTGGTLMGVGRRLKERNADAKLYAAEPLPGEQVQGLRSLDEGFVPEILDPSLLDGKFLVSAADSVRAVREFAQREAIFAGVSSGAVLVAAARVANRMERGTIVALLADGGSKYVSAGLWDRSLEELGEELESRSWW